MVEPVFQKPDPGSDGHRRLLLLSYHFPPASTAGSLRWQMLARHAVRRGWVLDVVTLHPAEVENPDPQALAGLPPGTRVFGVPKRRPWLDRIENGVWSRVRGYREGRLRVRSDGPAKLSDRRTRPDSLARDQMGFRSPADLRRAYHSWRALSADQLWAEDGRRIGERILDAQRPAVIVSCGPPHMVHVAASRLAGAHAIPHVVDMRDPWSLVERLPESVASPFGLQLARRHEGRVISRAALVVANTDLARDALRNAYPEAAARTITVMNGYDEDPLPGGERSSTFRIAYAGTVYLDRDPRPLFRAIARLRSELELTDVDLEVAFLGHAYAVQGRTLLELAEEAGAGNFVRVLPPAPRSEAQRFLATASMLVSLPQDSDMAIPSKIFEYLRFPAWVLALAEPHSATALALADTRADVVSLSDEDTLAEVIRQRFLEHREGIVPAAEPPDGALSRAAQAGVLFDAIGAVLDGHPTSSP